MRLSAKLATAGLALIMVVVACGGDDDDEKISPRPGEDGETITPAYCTQYCNAKAQQGTLQGSRAACFTDCCTNVAGGCPESDAGTSPRPDAGTSDGGLADGGCGTPCATGEACSFAGPTPACVKTCRKSDDCASGCCAPATNAAGDPVGPYVCKQTDGSAYGCCSSVFTTCSGAHCCVSDSDGNQFCARPCTSNGICGAANCTGYTFGTFSTTCSGDTACGPGL